MPDEDDQPTPQPEPTPPPTPGRPEWEERGGNDDDLERK
jgi:hypothetical protein